MTQKEMVLMHLEHYGSITPLEALEEYGCYRLGARIADLREDGWGIRTECMSTKNKTGKTVVFARYIMESAPKEETK